MSGLFGKMFDLNRDGKLDSLERAMDYMLFNEIMQEDDAEREDALDDTGLDSDDYDF